ncbi:DinB family protein [Streptomyces sp. ET3-23]|uniref:DinB family protein n=1 Tax=Streptomyces sp. ET3-23 TaxID=2885643 RepID=UPI001D0FE43C|nr:DinB family protein [Streptomyces sp. ET3-23]MCC2280604.1 DinB family protein [Streptomyces sp. ET3-23]
MTKTPDGRPLPPPQAGERAMLESWLEFHRATLVLKCTGLDDALARRTSAEPSPLTLLGLVRHMTDVERNWFQRVFAQRDVPLPYGEEQAYGFTPAPDLGMDEALAAWRAETDASRAAAAGASLDDTGRLSERDAAQIGFRDVSLRWIMVHMIEEYARHNGHADLIRERIDGATGI